MVRRWLVVAAVIGLVCAVGFSARGAWDNNARNRDDKGGKEEEKKVVVNKAEIYRTIAAYVAENYGTSGGSMVTISVSGWREKCGQNITLLSENELGRLFVFAVEKRNPNSRVRCQPICHTWPSGKMEIIDLWFFLENKNPNVPSTLPPMPTF